MGSLEKDTKDRIFIKAKQVVIFSYDTESVRVTQATPDKAKNSDDQLETKSIVEGSV